MRILVISHEYPPLGTGAAGALSQLLPRWAERGAEVTLVTAHWQELPREETMRGVRIRRVPSGRKKRVAPSAVELLKFLWAAPAEAIDVARQQKPDIVVGFFTLPGGAIARQVARAVAVPYMVALRGSDVPGYDTKRFGGLLQWTKGWVRRIWRDAAAVVPNSSWLRDLALQTSPTLALPIIPNGVEIQGNTPERVASENGPLRVLFVGQLVARKGVDLLIEAVAATPNFTLEIIGDGPRRGELEQLVMNNCSLDGHIAFRGLLERNEVRSAMESADVLALPTDAEGMSNVVLEAMASGLPVVTTAAGAADLIDDGVSGIVVARSAAAFAEGLKRLADPNLRREIGRRAYERASEQSWDRVAGNWLELFTRCTDQTTAARSPIHSSAPGAAIDCAATPK